MADDLESLRTEQDFLEELNRLRITAARKRGKVRLSLYDLEVVSGIPKSSLANYLTGRTRMPADVLDRLVLALGVPPQQAGAWATAWERTAGRRAAEPAAPKSVGRPHDADEIAAALREIAALAPASSEAAGRPAELTSALEGLTKDLAEFGFVIGEVRDIASQLQQELYRQENERREDRDRNRRQAAQLRLIRDGLRGIEQSRPESTSDDVLQAAPWRHQPPYRGLWPFQEDQSAVFHGRERTTADLVGRVEQQLAGVAMLVITGASGAGKSSLVRAGLLPAIAQGQLPVPGSADWPRLVVTPGTAPLDELAAQLAVLAGVDAGSVRDNLVRDPGQARLLCRQAIIAHATRLSGERRTACLSQGRLVLVVDQLEEIFALGGNAREAEQHRRAYLDTLLAIATPDPAGDGPATGLVVLTLRGDHLDRCAAYPGLVPVLQDGQVVVGPMTEGELRRAITGPASAAGLDLEAGLADDILAELRQLSARGAAGIGALPLLSQAMLLTWQHRDGDRLTRKGYGSTGGVARVIATSAEDVYESLTVREQAVARDLFRRMTVVGAEGSLTRRSLPRRWLTGTAGQERASRYSTVLDAFAAKRLVVVDRDSVEIAHDVLLHAWPRLTEWLDADRNDLAQHGQLRVDAAAWLNHHRDSSFLYRGTQLAAARQVAARLRAYPGHVPMLTASEMTFLDAAEDAAQRSARIRTAVTAIMTLLALLAGVAAVTAVRYAAEADRQHAVALSRQLAAESRALAVTQPMVARRLAAAAWAVAPTEEAHASMADLLAEERSVLVGHTDQIRAMAFSPNSRQLATAGADCIIRLWNIGGGDPVSRPLTGHTAGVNAVVFSPDNRLLASASDDGTVRIWHTATNQPVGSEPAVVKRGRVLALAFNQDGTRLRLAGDGMPILELDVRSNRMETLGPAGQSLSAETAAFDATGDTALLGGTNPASVRRWQHLDGVPTLSELPVAARATSVGISADGRRLASVDAVSGTVYLWPGPDSPPKILADETTGASRVVFGPGNRLAVVGNDRKVRIWDGTAGRPTGVASGEHTNYVSAVAFSPDGRLFATVDGGQLVRLWRTDTGAPVGFTFRQFKPEPSLAFDPGGRFLAGVGADHRLSLWQVSTGLRNEAMPTAEPARPAAIGFDRTRNGLITVQSGAALLRRYDPTTWRSTEVALEDGRRNESEQRLSPDGRFLLAKGGDGVVRVWDTTTGRIDARIPADQPSSISSVSPDGTRVMLASAREPTVQLWSLAADRPLGPPLRVDPGAVPVRASAFSADNHLIATSGADNTVRLWRIGSAGQPTAMALLRHPDQVVAMAFHPDRSLLVTIRGGGTMQFWDTTDGRPVGRPTKTEADMPHQITFSPDGGSLIVVDSVGTLRVWRVAHLSDPARALCDLVGAPSGAEWARYATGEPMPRVCG